MGFCWIAKCCEEAWNLQNQTEVSLNGPVGQVHCMVADIGILFAGIEDGTILAWKWCPESNIPEPAATLKGHNGAVCSLVIGANRLYSGSRYCTIKGFVDLCGIHDAALLT